MARRLVPLSFAEMVALSSKQGVKACLDAGEIVRVLPDQYAWSAHARSWVVRAHAALAWAGPASALCGASALYLWGAADQPSTVSIAAPWQERPRGPGWLRVKRFTHPPAVAVVRGFRVVDADVAVVVAHAELPPGRRAEAVYRPLRAGLVTSESVGAALASIGRVRGRGELTRRLAAAAQGSESYLEERSDAMVLRGPEFDRLVRQHLVRADGALYRLDAFDPETLTAFESDGDGSHSSPEARRRDIERDARLAALGILTVRFDYTTVMNRPEWCRSTALATMARRAPASQGLSVPKRLRVADLED